MRTDEEVKTPPVRDVPEVVIREARQRQRRRQGIVGVCLVVLVALVVTTAVMVSGNGKSPRGQVGTNTTPAIQVPVNASTRRVVLGADGLGAINTGASETVTENTLSRLLGRPTGSVPGVCRGTTELEWTDLSVEFTNGVLTGYRYSLGGFAHLGSVRGPLTGAGRPQLETAKGATLGMTLAKVRTLYPANAFSEEQGGSLVTYGTRVGDRLFLAFFSTSPVTPLAEIKGGNPCGDI
jgi:hypothetical protein